MIHTLARTVGMMALALAITGLAACTTDANGNLTWANNNNGMNNDSNPGNGTNNMNGNNGTNGSNNNSGMNGVGTTGTTSGLNR